MKKLRLLLASLTLPAIICAAPAQEDSDPPARKTITLPGGKAADIPPGPYTDSWESIKENYKTPQWFIDGKFGIFIHWGVYSVPAAGSEWYPRHMYGGMLQHHIDHWGNPKDFGYKDFISLFKAEKFNPEEWAELFKEAGATYVIPTAEHHDGFAMYDSKLTRWNAKQMGPKRDVIGELAKAVRAEGMKFGISNHRIEHWDFMYPTKAKEHDLYDPEYADFYGPPQKPDNTKASAMGPTQEEVMEGKEAPQSRAFLEEWLARCQEIIDNYRPDLVYFDNGINSRSLDPIKLRLAAYYYNRATEWGKPVSLTTKSDAYLYGTIRDFERMSRAPKEQTDYYWQVDDPIGHKFGYVEGLRLQSAEGILRSLINNISRNGNLCLNVSPKSDGTIPADQQLILRTIGEWLRTNGEAVYGSRAWKKDAEGDMRFTQKDGNVYMFMLRPKAGKTTVEALGKTSAGRISKVELLGGGGIRFKQTAEALHITLPENASADNKPITFRITLSHKKK